MICCMIRWLRLREIHWRLFHFLNRRTQRRMTRLTVHIHTLHIYYLPAGRSVLGKTVLEVLHKDWGQRPRSVVYIDQGHRFSQYGPPSQQITFLFFYLFLLKLLSALLVMNSLLSAGGQDGKILPAHEILRNQSGYRIFLSCPLTCPKNNNNYYYTYYIYFTFNWEVSAWVACIVNHTIHPKFL